MSLPTCPSCMYAQGICKKTGVQIRYSTGCTYHKPKRMTNADRIRAMTDEELAAFLDDTDGNFPPNVDWCTIEQSEQYWLEWLKEEIK